SQSEQTELSPPSMLVDLPDEETELLPPPIHTTLPRRAISSGQFEAAQGSTPASGMPFPVAPREWLRLPEPPEPGEHFPAFRNRGLVIAAISVVVMDALALIFGS